jgi:DNA invertase Pin-like site-specific DNA recombinase
MSKMKQLTEYDIQMIIADYVLLNSYRAVALKYNISVERVQRILQKHDKERQSATAIKKEIHYDVNNYIKSIQPAVKELIALYLKELFTVEKIAKASPKDLAIVMGILQDKFGVSSDDAVKSTHTALDGLIDKLKDKKPNE